MLIAEISSKYFHRSSWLSSYSPRNRIELGASVGVDTAESSLNVISGLVGSSASGTVERDGRRRGLAKTSSIVSMNWSIEEAPLHLQGINC